MLTRAWQCVLLLAVSFGAGYAQAPPGPHNFQELAEKADAARDAGRLDRAQALYQQALASRPSWADGWWSLGTILYDEDRYPGAARAFTRLLALDAKNGTAHLMLALCQYQLGSFAGSLRNIQKAEGLGIRKDDGLTRVLLYHKGMLLLRNRGYDDAMEALQHLVEDGVRSDDLDLALGMGALLLRPQDLPPAGSEKRQIVLRVGQAEFARLSKKYDEARERYDALVREFPAYPNIHYAYGHSLLASENPEAAVVQFQEEIHNDPKHVRARMQIAAARYRLDSAAGIPYVKEVIALQPRYPFGHYLLGLLYLDSGETAKAIPELQIAVRMVPEEAQFQFALGSAYAKVGRRQDAARARAVFSRLSRKSSSSSDPAMTGPTTYGGQRPLKLDSHTRSGPESDQAKQP